MHPPASWLWRLFLLLSFSVLHSVAHSSGNGSSEEDQSLLWGTYRPNLYFGLRPRLPQSLMSGLMWFGTQDFNQYQKIRHDCSQGDELNSYTWTEHDMRQGGVEVIKDGINNVELKIEWLKVPGGAHGGSWAARISGKPMRRDRPLRVSMIYYFGLEGLGSLDWNSDQNDDGITGPIHMSGTTPDLGDFKIRIEDDSTSQYTTRGGHAADFAPRLGKIHYFGTEMPAGDVWKAKDYLYQHIGRRAQQIVMPYKEDPTLPDPAFVLTMGNVIARDSNFYAVQKTFDGAFSFDVIFDSDSAGTHINAATITSGIESFVSRFDTRFQSLFPTRHEAPQSELEFSKAITSNLMGGIGYFYGTWIKDNALKAEWDQEEDDGDDQAQTIGEPKLQPPAALLTATPSRSFFPRGFYWDEGFHLLLIGAWDNDLSLTILRDWINMIDEDGWVGREQILGEEARSKVPPEFQAQYPSNANPPTLVLAVTAFIERLVKASANAGPSAAELGMDNGQKIFGSKEAHSNSYDTSGKANQHLVDRDTAVTYLRQIYPALRRHYDWFRTTQRGKIKAYARKARSRTEAYRWRGRTKDHVLTSGMDDYPRGTPHAGELHVDLISWMGFFTRTMKSIATFLGETGDETYFTEVETAILGNLEDLHWNAEEEMYCDLGVNDDDESVFVCNKGYLSLFPFLLGLIPSSSPHLGPVLDLLSDPLHLWSPYGLRSLSASHPLFGQGENYWRGPIWIQMNYLALSSLYKVYAAEPGPHQERARKIYDDLRENVVRNVFKEYERTGYVWEQYDPMTGEGKRSHPFTGWTALVTLIISEKY
ncbi:glycoside hydrolase family 63 protein [Serendipita vermifera MAFF 305830]|uniref:Mannosyl-oligosaccharide glucosidase n=1 Tax=Serendipita vermifera MAFF 305830 TaxID=933852 RepID=A0A0C3BHB7_SERVB|nr:glycoside hydrolase family 63 protein [Serendipita vermifera MAFF 305830]